MAITPYEYQLAEELNAAADESGADGALAGTDNEAADYASQIGAPDAAADAAVKTEATQNAEMTAPVDDVASFVVDDDDDQEPSASDAVEIFPKFTAADAGNTASARYRRMK